MNSSYETPAPSSMMHRSVWLAAIAGIAVGMSTGHMMGVFKDPVLSPQVETSAPVMDHSPMNHSGMAITRDRSSLSTGSTALQKANDKMHSAMATPMTGDVDLDFARGMIPHHQGAVEMAQVELEHGTDPTMRALARSILDTQQGEISTMHTWTMEHTAGELQ